MHPLKILIAEDEPELREVLTFMLQSKAEAEIVEVASGNEAIAALKTLENISCVVSDYSMPNGTGEDVFRFLLETKSSVPFILCSAYHPSKYPIFSKGNLFGFVVKPMIYEPLMELMTKISSDIPKPLQPNLYYPLRAERALELGIAVSDLYVKLSENKFVKLFHRGAGIDADEVAHLHKKGIDTLFVTKKDSETILQEMLVNLKAAAKKTDLAAKESIQLSAAALSVVTGLANSMGINTEVQSLTEECVQFTLKQVREDSGLHWQALEDILKGRGYLSTHTIAIAHMACWISSFIGWKSDLTFRKLILAAFFHDITLSSDTLARIQSLKELESQAGRFLDSEIDNFRRHTETAADLLRSLKDVPPDTDSIISQHHELPDGSGFPQGLSADAIAPLSALFIISNELVNAAIMSGPTHSLRDTVAEMSLKYDRGIFKTIMKGLVVHLSSQTAKP